MYVRMIVALPTIILSVRMTVALPTIILIRLLHYIPVFPGENEPMLLRMEDY